MPLSEFFPPPLNACGDAGEERRALSRPSRKPVYRFGDPSFFDCAGVRLLLDKATNPAEFRPQGCIYFRCADIALTVAELERRGVTLTHPPHRIAPMDDHDLWHRIMREQWTIETKRGITPHRTALARLRRFGLPFVDFHRASD